jgi:hypothetical protein
MALFTYFLTKDVLVVREGCTLNEGPERDRCLQFQAELAAHRAAEEKRRQEKAAKAAAPVVASAFEAEKKRQEQAVAAMQAALAARNKR